MTLLQTLDHELKKFERKSRVGNHFFLKLVRWIPPRPIDNAKDHALFLEILKKISLYLNETDADPSLRHNAKAKERKEGYSRYARVIEELIARYERERFPSEAQPQDTLAFLMEQHGLTQADIAEDIGGQPNVSAVLSGKRQLNLRQIRRLAARFHVSPLTFITV